MKTIKNAIGLILLLLSINNVFADDIDILYDRYWDLSVNNPSKESIEASLTLLNSDDVNSEINVYPNPTNQNITVSFGIDKPNAIEMYNAMGQSIYSKQLNKTAPTYESIDISRLQPGVYFLKVYTNNGAVLNKIIKN